MITLHVWPSLIFPKIQTNIPPITAQSKKKIVICVGWVGCVGSEIQGLKHEHKLSLHELLEPSGVRDIRTKFRGQRLLSLGFTGTNFSQKGLEVCCCLWGVPSRPSPGSYPGPVQVPSRVRGGPVQIRHVLCFTAFQTHPGPEVGAIPARPDPILVPSVPSRIGPGRAEADFLATSDFRPSHLRVEGPTPLGGLRTQKVKIFQSLSSWLEIVDDYIRDLGTTVSHPHFETKTLLEQRAILGATLGTPGRSRSNSRNCTDDLSSVCRKRAEANGDRSLRSSFEFLSLLDVLATFSYLPCAAM